MRFVPVTLALLAVVLGGLVGTSLGTDAPLAGGGAALEAQDNPIETSEESVAAGRTVYVRFCASCHGTNGRGDGPGAFGDIPPPNLVDDEWTHGGSDAEIFKTISEGVPPDYFMEEWAGRISDEEIWHVINYLRDLADR